MHRDGFQPWLDEEELIPGLRWEAEIRKAVRESDVVLVCLSERSASKDGFVQKEIRFALDLADEKQCQVDDRRAAPIDPRAKAIS